MSDDYEVGDRKPPKHTQFKKGKSGNPKGRPKGSKNLKTDLQEELLDSVRVTENGKSLKVSKQRLMIKALLTRAIKGDPRAADIIIRLMAQTLGLDAELNTAAPLGASDAAILDHFLADGGFDIAGGGASAAKPKAKPKPGLKNPGKPSETNDD